MCVCGEGGGEFGGIDSSGKRLLIDLLKIKYLLKHGHLTACSIWSRITNTALPISIVLETRRHKLKTITSLKNPSVLETQSKTSKHR